jgi:2-keto-4-pentenoate hydratase
VLGDPRNALAWLVNEVANYCGGILAGDRVTTGTCITPVVIAPGDLVTVDYGVLGSMSVKIL